MTGLSGSESDTCESVVLDARPAEVPGAHAFSGGRGQGEHRRWLEGILLSGARGLVSGHALGRGGLPRPVRAGPLGSGQGERRSLSGQALKTWGGADWGEAGLKVAAGWFRGSTRGYWSAWQGTLCLTDASEQGPWESEFGSQVWFLGGMNCSGGCVWTLLDWARTR